MDKMKIHNKSGFTLVELLTVLAIITMLIGLMVPSLNMARKFAKETKQKAQLSTIGAALTAFRGDYGDYPPSDTTSHRDTPPPPRWRPNYSGAQKLCEAMLGWDLMGFHPRSGWRADGLSSDYSVVYDASPLSISERRGRYLELATIDAYRVASGLEGLYDPAAISGNLDGNPPILYFRANTAGQSITEIYNHEDNLSLILTKQANDGGNHPLTNPVYFYGNSPAEVGYIQDSKVLPNIWPHRPDSYLLISAGADGLYGTNDDVCNFDN
jgi:prepilin-type N-terminal cleavage/methylation domain-containing protein